MDEVDPLLVVSFETREGLADPVLIILTMIDHADMFGAKGEAKHNRTQINRIHIKPDNLIQGKFPDDDFA